MIAAAVALLALGCPQASSVRHEVRIIPAFEAGRPIGFKVFSVRPEGTLAALGVKSGDVFGRINGLDLTAPEKALEVYRKLTTAHSYQIELRRHRRWIRLEVPAAPILGRWDIDRLEPAGAEEVEDALRWWELLQAMKARTGQFPPDLVLKRPRLRWIAPPQGGDFGCLYGVGPDGREGTPDDLRVACDLELLTQRLLVAAARDCARDRQDAFGNDIALARRGSTVVAWSAGADGRPDTGDDPLAVAADRGCSGRLGLRAHRSFARIAPRR